MTADSLSTRESLTRRVKAIARRLGFDQVGVTTAEPFFEAEGVIVDRVRKGLMDGLPWYSEARVRRGCHPERVLPEARSIIAVGVGYATEEPQPPSDGRPRGRVSRYAWGRDYHRVLEKRMKALVRELQPLGGGRAKFYVDYGPTPDRAVAARAGLGWYGKNTNLLTTARGSWMFLGEVLTDLDLEPDRPLKKSCGRCTTCIPACPTGAIVAPYVIDNTKCISYHTIENRGAIPTELRSLIGDWVFGCDICQDVCPVNGQARLAGDREFRARSLDHARPDLVGILDMTEAEFQERYRASPIRRATYAGFQRNACVALGNSGSFEAVPALARALTRAAPLVRGHAAWALGRIGGREAYEALRTALGSEAEPDVVEELRAALAGTQPG